MCALHILTGPRLIKLQQFSARQRPSKLTYLWRDRRNPLQWYTFWAVSLLGGGANILSALQLAAGIAQLKASLWNAACLQLLALFVSKSLPQDQKEHDPNWRQFAYGQIVVITTLPVVHEHKTGFTDTFANQVTKFLPSL